VSTEGHSGVARRPRSVWERAHLNVVALIGAIVAIAILSIVFAVLASARRADAVADTHERDLFAKTIAVQAERVLREIESVAAPADAVRAVRQDRDRSWIDRRIGTQLRGFFRHDFVFVIDANDELLYSFQDNDRSFQNWFQKPRRDLDPVIAHLRNGPAAGDQPYHPNTIEHPKRMAQFRQFLGRPAVIAGILAAPIDPKEATADDRMAPIILSVKFIGDDMLSDIAARLNLRNLRRVETAAIPAGDTVFDLGGDHGETMARIAWTPQRPGAEIAWSVVPFVGLALASFAILAAFVFSYMRRATTTIAQGETRLRHLALQDPLSGLPNRIFFGERLEAAIHAVRNGAVLASVFYIDLDHFKDVNDTLGHPVGDELIRNVTLRLSRALRGNDLVARLGGDEFAVLAPNTPDRATAEAIAERILSSLCAPYSVNGHTIAIGASIGIAMFDQHAERATDIMRYADMALYRAKNEGRNRACIYDSAMDADLTERKELERDLRQALADNRLHLHYQPMVNASGNDVIGVEALARWHHPARGDVPPREFIPIAENSGLIIALGEWVLRRACSDARMWANLTMAVNVSPQQFRRGDFVDMVERILCETGYPATRLELELSEGTLIGNVDTVEAAMLRLKALGVCLTLDDFGVGHSSLLYLRRFPFDKLKIDNSFVSSIETAADAAAIVHAIVSLGRGLGMKVTAEGVETAEQQLFLRAAGVHCMQGFRFGRPMRADKIEQRLAPRAGALGTHAG
jgi:diguanylate cyclase (GGDEF)-like protein